MSSVFIRRALCSSLLATLWFLASSISTAQASPLVWVTPSLSRTGPSDPAGSGGTAQIFAAKGESESFQIVVRAPAGGLSSVNVTISDLQGPGGAVIPKSSFTLYREHFVYVNSSSPDWGGLNRPLGTGWYADGLIPFNDPATGLPLNGAALDAVPFNLNANQNQPIWVDLLVPRGAAPGAYSGTFTVSSNQGTTSGSISLTIWDFTLPMKPSLMSSFLLWQSDGLLAQQELLRHRLSPLKSNPLNQSSLVNNYGLGSVGLPFWSGADLSNCSMSAAPSVSEFQASATQQSTSLHLYTYSADEIGHCTNLYPNIKQWARNMHQAGVDNLITMSPVPELYDDGSGSGRSAVDIWVLLPIMHDQSRTQVSQVLQKGDDVWSYNTLVQDSYSPKWLIDFAPINFRVQPGFINQSLNLTGLLYWRMDLWQSDPWNNVNNTGTFSSANYPGDGMLIYPGQQVGIAGVTPSIRLKWLRDGVDDYDYVEILEGLGRGDWALQQARTVGADWGNWTRNPQTLESVRRQLGEEIHRLKSGSTSALSAPTSRTPANGATGVSSTPTLSWSGGTGATSYDVYFGNTASPAFVTSTTANNFSPGSLSSGATYYWRVVARNSSSTASSPIWSFTTGSGAPPPPGGSAPAAVSVSPSSGSGSSQTFAFGYSDPNGASDLAGAGAIINTSTSGTSACWVYYEASGNRIWLANNDASNWSWAAIGSATVLSNSQCSLSGSGVSVSSSGNSLTVSVALTFTSSFAGGKTMFLYANDKAGLSSGYQPRGTWTVTSAEDSTKKRGKGRARLQ